MGRNTIRCYRERDLLERNYSPSVDAFEDTLKELQETNQLDTNDDFKQAVHLEWYYRVFKAKHDSTDSTLLEKSTTTSLTARPTVFAEIGHLLLQVC